MSTGIAIVIVALAALAAALGAAWRSARREAARLVAEKCEMAGTCERAESALQDETERRAVVERELAALRASSAAEIASLRERNAEEREARRVEREKEQEALRLQFRDLAAEIFDEKSRQFRAASGESLEALLGPFRDKIADFRTRVEQIHAFENEQRGALREELRRLMELNRTISVDAQNLTNALKGNSKVQGDWGEMILDTILESSNLVCGIHYERQCNLKDAEGNNLRPDVILRLPGGKQIVIDSKVSLTAYAGYAAATDEATRQRLLTEHVRSVRAHVDELGGKRYQELVASPDFVILFMPNEPAFMTALQADSTIWNDAYRRKVILSSPTNLFALLKIVDDLWRRDNQSRNALEIADEGGKLYDKFVGFVETLETLGRSLASTSAAYDRAMIQLKTGSGNLVGRTEKLRRLGVKAAKSLPRPLVDAAEAEDGEEALPQAPPIEKK